MEYSNEPMDPLPAVLPDVDLPCTCGHDGRCDNSGKRCANYRLATLYFEPSGTAFYKPKDRNTSAGFVYRVPWSLVRAALAQPAEVKVYGTMPKQLPRCLPAGTRYDFSGTLCELIEDARLTAYGVYCGKFRHVDDGSEGEMSYCAPRCVDWSTVPIHPAPARSGSDVQRQEAGIQSTHAGDGKPSVDTPVHASVEPERTDPYVEHRRKLATQLRVTDPEGAVFTKTKSADDWRGNYQREAIRPAKQRKPVEHPAAWPSDCDSEELYVS